MKKFIVKMDYQIEIEANNEDEAYEKFFEGVETEPQQTLATFVSDNLTIKEKMNKKSAIKAIVFLMSLHDIKLQDFINEHNKQKA